jgi:hypothetical protein
MIQRIQSIYLLLAVGLMLITFFLPVASFYGEEGSVVFVFKAAGIYSLKTGEIVFAEYTVPALVLITVINSIVTIFLFKKRPLQIKLTRINSILMILVYALIFICGEYFISGTNYALVPQFSMLFPFLSIIVTQLAARRIRKDEDLVRSLDRLR